MLSAISRAAGAMALLVLASATHAEPAARDTRSLAPALAANRALPPAAAIADEAFNRRARLRDVQLSPDGNWLSYIDNDGKNAKLMLRNLLTQETKQLLPSVGRAEAHWSADSRLLFLDSGDGLSLLRLSDGSSEKLMAFDPKLRQQFVAMARDSALVDQFDGKTYRLNRIAADGQRTLLYTGPRPLRGFLTDEHGQLTFVHTTDEAWNQFLLRHNDDGWQEVMRCKPLKPCSLVNADARHLRVQANVDDDRRGLVELDLTTGKRRTLHTDPLAVSDLRQVVQSASQQQAMFAVYDLPTRRNIALLSKYRQAEQDIARRFPDSNITINAGDDAPRWLLTERGARLQHERYWLYERRTRSLSELLQAERQRGEPLAEAILARKLALHYRASDGVLVHGYLSLPPGQDASKLGLITMVHGGPWSRFDSEYTGLVQLLVNRGFAVFQPNFRASTGYGERYKHAPAGDFGNGRAQADIIEGVQWLLAHGVGQRDRLAIIGDSFGGYAILLALTFTPDMFRFGMATSPPTDFARTMQATVAAPGPVDAPPLSASLQDVGIDLADAATIERLAAQSPAANWSKVARPLLIMAGGKDERVDIASVTDYVARLRAAGKPVSLYVDDDEGHNLRKPQSRAAYLYLLQSLLHRHLGGPAPAAPSAELATVIGQNMKVNAALSP